MTYDRETSFRHALESAISKNSMENGSNTPDFILANYLRDCLRAFDLACDQREHWYGLKFCPGREPEKVGGA